MAICTSVFKLSSNLRTFRYHVICMSIPSFQSVVSGGSEPDNITITRTWDDKLTVGEQIIGSKKLKIETLDDGGTREEIISSEDSQTCCIKEEHLVALAEIGIQVSYTYKHTYRCHFLAFAAMCFSSIAKLWSDFLAVGERVRGPQRYRIRSC